MWTLTEDGKQIARWRECDHPLFAWWLQERLYERHGAWHVARTQLGIVDKNRVGAFESAKTRRGRGSKRAKVIDAVARLVEAKRDPLRNVKEIARRARCTERYVRTILAELK